MLALARHYVRGLAASTPVPAYAACLAAGRAALDTFAPAAAVDHLRFAAGLGVDPTAVGSSAGEVGSLLGTALYLTGDFAGALTELDAAIAASADPLRRAGLRARAAGVHRAVWDLDATIAATRVGLTELRGRWAPRNTAGFTAASLAQFAAGLLVGWTGIGFGTARGRARERYRQELALIAIGGPAAGMSNGSELFAFTLRTLYAASRLGPGPEYATAMATFGSGAAIMGRNGIAARCFARAEASQRSGGDLRLAAAIADLRSFGRYCAGLDDGTELLAVLDEHGTWLDLGAYCDLAATLRQLALLAGRGAEDDRIAAQVRRRTAGTVDLDDTMLAPMEALRLALCGQAAAAGTELRRVLGTPHAQRPPLALGQAIARLGVLAEEGDAGPETDAALDALVRAERTLGPPRSFRLVQPMVVSIAAARVRQLRAAAPADRPAAIAAARAAVTDVATLRRKPPETVAALHLLQADVAERLGHPERALAELGRIPLLVPDAPLVTYEAARVRARAAAALGNPAEAGRQVALALDLARTHGWPHRARWVTAEFGAAPGPATGPATGTAGPAMTARGTAPSLTLPVELELHRLRAVVEVSRLAAQTVVPDELARIALDGMIRILSAERALLFLSDAAGELTPYLGRDAGGATIEATGYASTLVRQVAASRETLVVTGTEEGAALGARSAVAHNLRSIMIAPLHSDDRLLGVVYLDSRIATGIFTAADGDVLTAVATHIAVALQTTRAAALEADVRAARHIAGVDELTGVATRRHFFDEARARLGAPAAGARPAALMIDIDHFKRINDEYGHPTGDDVIREVARRLAGTLRHEDTLGRYGGEEFAVLLDGGGDPVATAERLRAVIADAPVPTRSGPLPVTVSIGLATSAAAVAGVAGAAAPDVHALLADADSALYRAKRDGRNLVRDR